MRAMRAALLSARSVRALPVLSRCSVLARAPSRLVSTEAFAPPTPLSKHIEQFVPTAVIFTLILSIASVSAYYNGELMSLKKEIEGTAATLKKEIEGTAATLKKEIEGTAATLKSDMTGTAATLKSDMAGLKETIKSDMTGTASTLQERVAGIEKAADLKVR